ncbi:winged helix-turn-helix domain-containing protein [Pararhizobium arenae]|uniref:winged helix-turn-helix domain-containing protein n=1 Tax=Pararhizobium arenae TaxID=1856850 RepID=UPI00094B318E|nr:winged helix-turn-helix domain-containing protein [Pararhizobium arenae]
MDPIVLVATEDADFSLLLSHVLASGGFQAIAIAPCIEDVEARISMSKALIIDGTDIDRALELCRRVRTRQRTATMAMMVFIRARHEIHYLKFVKTGVDECVLRPLSPDLILSGLRAIIVRRAHPAQAQTSHGQTEHIGAMLLDGSTRMLAGPHGNALLSPTEYRILRRMLASPGRVVSRRDLIEAAWPPGRFVDDKTVDVHVSKLRKAIHVATGEKAIRTVRSNGFMANFKKA